MAVRTGRVVVRDRRTAPAHIPACSVEHDAPYPGLERAIATEGAALAHRRRERFLHCVTRSVGVPGHARRDANEDIEAAAVQRFELIEARSVASDHTSLMRTMSIFFSGRRPTVRRSLGDRGDRWPGCPAEPRSAYARPLSMRTHENRRYVKLEQIADGPGPRPVWFPNGGAAGYADPWPSPTSSSGSSSWRSCRVLIDGADATGTVRMLALLELVEPYELDPLELEALRNELEARGLELVEEPEPEEAPAAAAGSGRGRAGDDDRRAAAVPPRGRPAPAADGRAGGRAREGDRARRPTTRSSG